MAKNPYYDYPARIVEAHRARGLTREALAEMADISSRHLGDIERGTANPSLDTMYRISKVLGVSLSILLGQE